MTEPTAATLVLCDWRQSLNLEAWIECGRYFFDLIGATPNAVTYWQGEGRERKVSVAHLSKIVQKTDVSSIGLYELMPPFDDLGEYKTYASFSTPSRAKTSIFTYNHNSIDISLTLNVIRKFVDSAAITYGYAYLRPLRLGPAMYAYGISVGLNPRIDSEREEQKEIGAWQRERLDMIVQKTMAPFRHLDGLLRDVYPLNVLTEPHVTKSTFGEPLSHWIARESWHGYLEEVSAGVWIWLVPERDLLRVRKALQPTGMLIVKPPE